MEQKSLCNFEYPCEDWVQMAFLRIKEQFNHGSKTIKYLKNESSKCN